MAALAPTLHPAPNSLFPALPPASCRRTAPIGQDLAPTHYSDDNHFIANSSVCNALHWKQLRPQSPSAVPIDVDDPEFHVETTHPGTNKGFAPAVIQKLRTLDIQSADKRITAAQSLRCLPRCL